MAAPDAGTLLAALLKAFARYLLIPLRRDYSRALSAASILFVAIAIAFLVIMALPLMIRYQYCRFLQYHFPIEAGVDREVAKSYVDLASIILQIALAFTVGGFVFSERSSNIVRDRLQRYQAIQQAQAVAEVDRLEARMDRIVAEIAAIAQHATLLSVPRDIARIYRSIRALYRAVFQDLPNVYIAFMRAGVMVNFPGGLFGLFSFIAFWWLTAAAVAKMYLDYAPQLCR